MSSQEKAAQEAQMMCREQDEEKDGIIFRD